MTTTLVTAFFDIDREMRGDGRSISTYLEWIQKTLLLHCHLYVVTETKFAPFFKEHRPADYPMKIKLISFQESEYYSYYDRIQDILQQTTYREKVAFPNRVECQLPEYTILQFSKFHYLRMAIDENPFQSEFFLWIDAGSSRFFNSLSLSTYFPKKTFSFQKNLFYIQCRSDLFQYPLDPYRFIWTADNLMYGGMFGGHFEIVLVIASKVKHIFEWMLSQSNVNNEQLALALVWKDSPDLFWVIDRPHVPIYLLDIFSQTI